MTLPRAVPDWTARCARLTGSMLCTPGSGIGVSWLHLCCQRDHLPGPQRRPVPNRGQQLGRRSSPRPGRDHEPVEMLPRQRPDLGAQRRVALRPEQLHLGEHRVRDLGCDLSGASCRDRRCHLRESVPAPSPGTGLMPSLKGDERPDIWRLKAAAR